MINHWAKVSEDRWERCDGAVVKFDQSSPYPNPEVQSSRMWTAWEPEPSQCALSMERGFVRYPGAGISKCWRPRFPRRWKTVETAMKAVDREYPVKHLRKHPAWW